MAERDKSPVRANTPEQPVDEICININNTASRNPRKLYKWFREMNEIDHSFSPLVEDGSKNNEVKILCILFSERKIDLNTLLWCVTDLDLFDLKRLGPLLKNYDLGQEGGSNRPPYPKSGVEEVKQRKTWRTVFKK